jgi:hypothetical protein
MDASEGKLMKRNWKRCSWVWALLSASWLAGGCASCDFKPLPIGEDVIETCHCIAECSRKHTYIFFIQGLDPLDCAGLEHLKEQMQELGFPKAWYGASCYSGHFKKEIARIQEDDPCARFVLVAYGHGVNTAHDLAQGVEGNGVHFDLMLCIGNATARPENVLRLVTLLPCGHSCIEQAQEAGEVQTINVRSSSLPAHKETIEWLAHELLAIAGSIPAADDHPKLFVPEEAPTPKPVMPPADSTDREWDFLNPASVEKRPMLPPGTLPPPWKAPAPQPSPKQPGKPGL